MWFWTCKRIWVRIIRKNLVCCYQVVQGSLSHSKCQLILKGYRYLVSWMHCCWTFGKNSPFPRRRLPGPSPENYFCPGHTFIKRYEIHHKWWCHKIHKIPAEKNQTKMVKAVPSNFSSIIRSFDSNAPIRPWKKNHSCRSLK